MDPRRVVIAVELRSYREALARVFGKLRPDVEVSIVEPEDMDREVKRLRPDFVVCSRVTAVVESHVPVWIELYPEREAHSRVSFRDESATVADMQLADLLALLDRTRDLPPLG